MVTVTVRNAPAEVHAELVARAARAGRSLEEHFLAELVGWTRRPTVAEVLARARERVRAAGSSLSAERIPAHRDAGRA
jgi:antitoxin FitA